MSLHDPRALRSAFGSYMTGVTVVTTRTDNGVPVGFTANSFASVSLDPPLLLVCPGKALSSYDAFSSCLYFAVNVLAAEQEHIATTFARDKGDRFAKVRHSYSDQGVPLIEGAVARFSCKTDQTVCAGDHLILIGRVETFTHRNAPGLGFAAGAYFTLPTPPFPA